MGKREKVDVVMTVESGGKEAKEGDERKGRRRKEEDWVVSKKK